MKPIFSYKQYLISYEAFYYFLGGKNNPQNSYVGNKIPPPIFFLVFGSSLYVLSCNGSFSNETCIFFA